MRELRKRFSEVYHYKIAVKDWSCDYSFGINSQFNPLYKKEDFGRLHGEPYRESGYLEFMGVFVSSGQFKDKKIRFIFFERDYLNEAERAKRLSDYEESPPNSIGQLQKCGDNFSAYISYPEEAFLRLLLIASANKINFISLCTGKMRYGQAPVLSFSLSDKNGEEYEEEENELREMSEY